MTRLPWQPPPPPSPWQPTEREGGHDAAFLIFSLSFSLSLSFPHPLSVSLCLFCFFSAPSFLVGYPPQLLTPTCSPTLRLIEHHHYHQLILHSNLSCFLPSSSFSDCFFSSFPFLFLFFSFHRTCTRPRLSFIQNRIKSCRVQFFFTKTKATSRYFIFTGKWNECLQ